MHTFNIQGSRRGFTLVEIMIVVIIIGLLAALAIPTIHNSQKSARSATFINDIRTYGAAAEVFSLETGDYPEDVAPGVMPTGLGAYIPTMKWTSKTPLDGYWDFVKDDKGIVSGFGASGHKASNAQLMHIEQKWDDGSLSTGKLRSLDSGYYYIIAE
jgi:prepilin-type N-terminal cleavage/methylation domain-containing protein